MIGVLLWQEQERLKNLDDGNAIIFLTEDIRIP